jgi:hypothetical protein
MPDAMIADARVGTIMHAAIRPKGRLRPSSRAMDGRKRADGAHGDATANDFAHPYGSAGSGATSTGYEGGRRSALILKDFFPLQRPGREGSPTAAAGLKIFFIFPEPITFSCVREPT